MVKSVKSMYYEEENIRIAKRTPHLISSIVTLLVPALSLSVAVSLWWSKLPAILAYSVCAVIAILIAAFLFKIISPVPHVLQLSLRNVFMRRKQRLILKETMRLFDKGAFLFKLYDRCSLRSYINSLCNRLATFPTIHPQLKCLESRMSLLEDWHDSLISFVNLRKMEKELYIRRMLSVIRFYRDTAEVVRELVAIELPNDPNVKGLSDDRRMMAGNYNRHIDEIEEILSKAHTLDSSIVSASFHRF